MTPSTATDRGTRDDPFLALEQGLAHLEALTRRARLAAGLRRLAAAALVTASVVALARRVASPIRPVRPTRRSAAVGARRGANPA